MEVERNRSRNVQYQKQTSVLVVDHDLKTKEQLCSILPKSFLISSALTSEEGLGAFNKSKPDVIITELKLKNEKDFQFVRMIRNKDKNIPIIILTSHEKTEYFCKAIEYGVNHFILKPFQKEQMTKALSKSLKLLEVQHRKKQSYFTKTIVDYQEDLIITLNQNYKILDANQAFLRFCGAQHLHLLQDFDMNDFIVNDDTMRYQFNEVIDFLLNDHKMKHYKLRCKSCTNDERTYLVKASKIPNDENVLVVCTDITDLHREIEKNEFLAEKDALTKVYNRYKFESMLNQEIQRSNRYHTKLSLIIADVDHFKEVNDTYGHNIGDEILAKVAMLIQGKIRETDILARWGGEEFVILLPETDEAGAQQLAEKLRKLIELHAFTSVSTMTSSFGVCQYSGNATEKEFIYKADTALYQAKKLGRNRVVCYRDCETDN